MCHRLIRCKIQASVVVSLPETIKFSVIWDKTEISGAMATMYYRPYTAEVGKLTARNSIFMINKKMADPFKFWYFKRPFYKYHMGCH